jgi:hypothetical protein
MLNYLSTETTLPFLTLPAGIGIVFIVSGLSISMVWILQRHGVTIDGVWIGNQIY